MRALVITAWALAALATAASAPAQSLTPAAAGTIRKLPELGLFDLAPVGDAVQSSYFRSTTANREFRRGVAEFSIPPATILSATLVLAETRATIGAPLPPDVHHVSSYTPTDLAVTTADYDRAGAAVGTFATDANEAPQTFTFDVTALAVAAAGGTLGFRVQLEADPAYADLGTLGSAFAVTLEIVTAPIAMEFALEPRVLTLTSRGRWVTGYLEPAAPFAAGNIDVGSIRLNGTVAVDPAAPTALGDHDGDGIADLMVKFDRVALELIVAEGDDVAVIATGTVDGQPFSGTDHIRVQRGRITAPAVGRHLTAGSVAEVRWEAPGNVKIESVALSFSSDGGGSWSPVVHGYPNAGRFDWTVPNLPTERAKLAVLAESAAGLVDGVLGVSEVFSIEAGVDVGDHEPVQPALAIRGAAPNPARGGRLSVVFTLRDGSTASLALMDVAGRVLITRDIGSLGPGTHALELSEGGGLRSGIYFLRLRQNGHEVRARAAVVN